MSSSLARELLHRARPLGMFRAGMRLLIAVSGGADSVAMLRLLLELAPQQGWVVAVAHFDHQLRSESAMEAQFTRQLALASGVEFHLGRPTTPAPAGNLEAWARRQRYAFFHHLLAADAADSVATAHTLDDQAETVLLRLARGAGTAGLVGILPVLTRVPGAPPLPGTGPRVIRPVLSLSRRALREWLNVHGQTWCEDPSNAWLARRRNLLRHRLLPQLATDLNPRIAEVLATTATLARDEELWWADAVAKASASLWRTVGPDLMADKEALCILPRALRRRVLRAAIRHVQGDLRQVDFRHVEQLSSWVEETSRRSRQIAFARVTAHLDRRVLKLRSRLSPPDAGLNDEGQGVPIRGLPK